MFIDYSFHVPIMWLQGKDVVLNALSALCTSCHDVICASNPDAPNAIANLVSSACTKKAQKYREAAFSCLEQVLILLDSLARLGSDCASYGLGI